MTLTQLTAELLSGDENRELESLWLLGGMKDEKPSIDLFMILRKLIASENSEIRERAVFVSGILWNEPSCFSDICCLALKETNDLVLSAITLALIAYARCEECEATATQRLLSIMQNPCLSFRARWRAQGALALALGLVNQDEYFTVYGERALPSNIEFQILHNSNAVEILRKVQKT